MSADDSAKGSGKPVSLKSRIFGLYNIDNVPLWLQPPYFIYGYGLGTIFYIYFLLIRFTSRVHIEHGPGEGPFRGDRVYANWHDVVPAFFSAFGDFKPTALLNHPHWYMKPIHVALVYMGVKKWFYGSTGTGGREALDALTVFLREHRDYYTFITPDGPYGPKYVPKKGVFHLARASGRKVVALSIHASPVLKIPSWDRKKFPLPFAKIHVRLSSPIDPPADIREEHIQLLTRELSYLDIHQNS